MAKNAEMDAKDIAILFRSFADAGLESWISKGQDPPTFAEQDFDTQMGWFADQIEARVGEKSPSPDVLALMAARFPLSVSSFAGSINGAKRLAKSAATWSFLRCIAVASAEGLRRFLRGVETCCSFVQLQRIKRLSIQYKGCMAKTGILYFPPSILPFRYQLLSVFLYK